MEEYKKIIKMDKKLLVIIVILIALIPVLLYIDLYLSKSGEREKVVEDYTELIAYGKDVENKYVELKITKLPHGIDTEKTDLGYEARYYFASDEDNFRYIVRLSGSTYKLLEDMYKENPEEFSYTLKGYIFEYPIVLKKLAINEYNRINKEELINEENFEIYFGTTYLDENKTPSNGIRGIVFLIGFFALIALPFCLLFYIISIIGYIKSKINIKKYYKDLEDELSNGNIISYKKPKIHLTNKYIISKNWYEIIVLEYNKLIWIYYNEEQNEAGLPTGRMKLMGYDANNEYLIAIIKDENMLKEITNKIIEKNPQVLVGYTVENKQKYKEIKNNK